MAHKGTISKFRRRSQNGNSDGGTEWSPRAPSAPVENAGRQYLEICTCEVCMEYHPNVQQLETPHGKRAFLWRRRECNRCASRDLRNHHSRPCDSSNTQVYFCGYISRRLALFPPERISALRSLPKLLIPIRPFVSERCFRGAFVPSTLVDATFHVLLRSARRITLRIEVTRAVAFGDQVRCKKNMGGRKRL